MLQVTKNCVKHAKDIGLVVELSAEDATRSDRDYLKKVFSTGMMRAQTVLLHATQLAC
jgi:isopropylmalate/homocitrate/citramalate synthase